MAVAVMALLLHELEPGTFVQKAGVHSSRAAYRNGYRIRTLGHPRWHDRAQARRITLIGLTLSNLTEDRAIQLALPLDRADADAIDVALDCVKERFGSNAVTTRAVLLGRGQGICVPLLPD